MDHRFDSPLIKPGHILDPASTHLVHVVCARDEPDGDQGAERWSLIIVHAQHVGGPLDGRSSSAHDTWAGCGMQLTAYCSALGPRWAWTLDRAPDDALPTGTITLAGRWTRRPRVVGTWRVAPIAPTEYLAPPLMNDVH